MEWSKPKFSKKQVNRAGEMIRQDIPNVEDIGEYIDAQEIVNNWRASHAFPLNTFQTTLRRYGRHIDFSCIVAQRIKRMSSIYSKLVRFPTMTLSQMQDIGGCRAILSSIEDVNELIKLYQQSDIKHKLQRIDNYIEGPKISGYRGVHLIYRYNSDRIKDFNSLLIEVQIRTTWQHAWATAVETVGTFVRQALKSSQGEEEWLELFKLMGSAIAMMESTPLVPDTPNSPGELTAAIRDLERRLDIIARLSAFNVALEQIDPRTRGDHFYLLRLDAQKREVTVEGFKAKESELASAAYDEAEKSHREDKAFDAVLVSVDSIGSLKKAYPNYFLDTSIFLDIMSEVIDGLLID